MAAVGLALVLVAGAGCDNDSAPAPDIVLDGRPHPPTDEGVLTSLTRARLGLDSKREYDLSGKVQVFAAATLERVPLGGRMGQYVQVGIERDTVVWVSTFSAVVQLPDRPRLAFHIGKLARVSGGRATFEDGTVLRLADGVAVPTPLPLSVRAEIDADAHRVVTFVRLSP